MRMLVYTSPLSLPRKKSGVEGHRALHSALCQSEILTLPGRERPRLLLGSPAPSCRARPPPHTDLPHGQGLRPTGTGFPVHKPHSATYS
ncbi:rCG50840 [Rattus norvegicus]|uniref:RCG50840 n=1 Tax=Rattus norvegicus TaxID=10116 RepID=A6KC85_RAT|nr:rCG50840 [Rattus norvegicus]